MKLKPPEDIGKSITFTPVETPHLKIPPLKCGLAMGRRVKETSVCEWIHVTEANLQLLVKAAQRWSHTEDDRKTRKGNRQKKRQEDGKKKKEREHPPLPQISLGPRQSD